MSEVWFQVWLDKIDPVKVDNYSEKSVWIDGRRLARSGWRDYFPTWAEAHEFLIKKAESDLNDARLNLERMRGRHGQIKGMRPPVTEYEQRNE